jgi:hypothetical protein
MQPLPNYPPPRRAKAIKLKEKCNPEMIPLSVLKFRQVFGWMSRRVLELVDLGTRGGRRSRLQMFARCKCAGCAVSGTRAQN